MYHYRIADFLKAGDLCHVARTRIGRWPHVLHDHDFAEVFWIESGICQHMVNGQEMTLAVGDLVLIRPADAHTFHAPSSAPGGDALAPCDLLNVAFPDAVRQSLLARLGADDLADWGADTPIPQSIRLSPTVLHALGVAAADLAAAKSSALALERFLLNLLHELRLARGRTLGGGVGTNSAEPLPDWLEHAVEAIREPEQFRRGVDAFVRLAGRSPEHVARTARRLLGRTPSELVLDARLDYAASELGMSERPIADIALDCGFDNLGYFYRCFRRAYQLTPRLYRRHQRALV